MKSILIGLGAIIVVLVVAGSLLGLIAVALGWYEAPHWFVIVARIVCACFYGYWLVSMLHKLGEWLQREFENGNE